MQNVSAEESVHVIVVKRELNATSALVMLGVYACVRCACMCVSVFSHVNNS
jgi:hypothetical protein